MNKQIFFTIALSVLSTSVWADTGDQYSFIKIGSMTVDEGSVENLTTIGYTYGLGITQRISFEFEADLTTQGGNYSTNNASGQYEVITIGSFLVHRESFSQNLYGKIKIGAIFERINIQNEVSQTESQSDGVHASAGIGAGYAFSIADSKSAIEIEATVFEKNISLYSLGLNISF